MTALGTKASSNDLNCGLNRSSSLFCSSIPRGSLAVLSAYRRYDSRRSPTACFRSSSVRTRKVIQPELGTQWCSSASPPPRVRHGLSAGGGCQRSRSYERIRLRLRGTEILPHRSGVVKRHIRPGGDFIFELLQVIHTPHTPQTVFDA